MMSNVFERSMMKLHIRFGVLAVLAAFAAVSASAQQTMSRQSPLERLRARRAGQMEGGGGSLRPGLGRPGLPKMQQPADAPGAAASNVPMAPNTVKHFGDQVEDDTKTTMPALKFEQSDAVFLMEAYAQEVGRTLLIAPDLPKVTGITLRSQKGVPLTRSEYLEAIEAALGMNGISLQPYGDKFLKAVQAKTIRTSGLSINMEKPDGGHPEKGRVVSQMIQLKNIAIDEAQKALDGFKSINGLIQAFERTNSLLVTDVQENINRMLEIVRFIDQAVPVTEEVHVRLIAHAKAEEIKTVLMDIVEESQRQTSKKEEVKPASSGAPGMQRVNPSASSTASRLRSALRPRDSQAAADPTPNANLEALMADAERGMIRGKVQIIADERSNQLIIITRKENMNFFDKIITVLDIETTPEVKVEVRRLEFADAEEVAQMLNDLIGNSSSSSSKNSNSSNRTSANGSGDNYSQQGSRRTGPGGRSSSLSDAAAAAGSSAAARAVGSEEVAKLGKITKDDINILADKRTNAIVMMGRPAAIKAIMEVIGSMDIQLAQVLIETVVVQVSLGDDLQTGIDWIKSGKKTVPREVSYTDENGDTQTRTIWESVRDATHFGNGNMLGGGGGTKSSMLSGLLEAGTNAAAAFFSKGLNYFLKSDKLQIEAVIHAAKNDNRAKVLSSPILMTVDNKEATIEATDMRYLYKGVRYSGSSYNGTEVPDYEQRDIGLTVKVTPRISPNGNVMLTVEETFETIGANQAIGGESYPTVTTRKLQADISLQNMQTVVLGGLVQNDEKYEEGGIPILKDIPVIGKYLFGYTSKSSSRSELLVFMTPYVFNDPESLQREAMRRKDALSDSRPWIDNGWSASKVADPLSKSEKLRRQKDRWYEEDSDHRAEREFERALRMRKEQLRRRAEKEAKEALKEAQRSGGADKPVADPQEGWVTGVSTSQTTRVVR